MNYSQKKVPIQKAKTVRIKNHNEKENPRSSVSIKDDIFLPENPFKNEKQVLLPFDTTQSNNIIPTIACLLIPSNTALTHRMKSSTPRSSFRTHRKYNSTHIEMPSHKALSAWQSERHAGRQAKDEAKRYNCKSHTFFTQKGQERIPKLYKNNWNSLHQNKASSKINNHPNLKKIKLRSLKQKDNIVSKSEGILTLNMQCIPFSIWNRNTRRLLVRSEKQSPSKRQDENVKSQKDDGENQDRIRRLQLLSRQNNLRKKILMNVLQGNPYGSQARRPFICYFPHTDYDLALKDYIKRHEELEGRTRFLSLSKNNDVERLEKTEHIVFKRESCVNFTDFNRQKYDIKMTRADLIKTILEKKATEQITVQFAREMRGKIEKLIVQAIKQQSQSSNSSKSLPFQKTKSRQSLKKLMKVINIASQSKEIAHFDQQKKNLNRLSRIMSIVSQRRDSQLKIYSDLIEGLQEKYAKQKNRNSVSAQSQIEQVQSDKCQDSLQKMDKIQNKARRNIQIKKPKQGSSNHNGIKEKMRVRKQTKRQQSKPLVVQSKTVSKQNTNISGSVFKRQAISKKTVEKRQKQQQSKSNELKKVNREQMRKRIQRTAKQQQKYIHFTNIAPQQGQADKHQLKSHLTLRTNTENITINSQSKHIIPTNNEITEVSQTLVRVPSNYSRKTVIQSQGQAKLTVVEIVKQYNQIQKVQPLLWQPFWQRINIALKIIRWASEQFYQKLMTQNVYFIGGQWIKLTILETPQAQQQNYATGLYLLCIQRLQIRVNAVSLQLMLKLMTGQRIILFRNKLKVEDEVNYHCSKGHLIYLLPKHIQQIQSHQQLPEQHNYPSFRQLNQVMPFDKIIGQYQLISINNRIKNRNLFRSHLQTYVSDHQSRTIFLNTSISTVGTITLYFPFFKSDFYVELLMQKKSIDKLTGQAVFKQIGRVRQRVKYDNIYFQFTIKGQYELRITVEDDNHCNFRICSQSNNQISLSIK